MPNAELVKKVKIDVKPLQGAKHLPEVVVKFRRRLPRVPFLIFGQPSDMEF